MHSNIKNKNYGQESTNGTLYISLATSVVTEVQRGDTISVRVGYKSGES